MAQLVYNKDPKVAMQGQLAEPMAPMRIISRLVETAALEPGVAVTAGTDASKQVVLSTTGADLVGITCLQDYLESKPTGVVDADTGEIMTEAKYQVGKQVGVMAEGTVFMPVGVTLALSTIGGEVGIGANGYVIDGAATGAYRLFLEEAPEGLTAGALVKIRIAGPQGA